MDRYPRKDRDARTGSNLPGTFLQDHRRGVLAGAAKPFERLSRERHRLEKALFSRADLRRVREIGREVYREWREASLRAGGEAPRVDALKLAARKKFERVVAREFPQYRQWKTLRRAHLGAHAKLRAGEARAANRVGNASLQWGRPGDPGSTARVFTPPFTTFDVDTLDLGGFVVSDESFARPAIGHLVNLLVFDQDESTGIGAGLLGILPVANAGSFVSCGVAFTTPSEGRLKISADVLNLYNRLTFSVTDNFGRSSASVGIGVELFATVLRGSGAVEQVARSIHSTGIESGGSDQHRVETELDTTAPFTMVVETATRYDPNESVLVLAGTAVRVNTLLDDMHCKADAVLWWQLQRLTVEMAIDVF